MKTVRDDDGNRYLLLKRAGDASLVRDPTTGNECYVQNDRLEDAGGESPLEVAASGVDDDVRTLLSAVRDERALGLLVEFADRGPLDVRTLLDAYDLCESDLHGTLAELRVAGLLEETTVAGERGYRATDRCTAALEIVRGSSGD